MLQTILRACAGVWLSAIVIFFRGEAHRIYQYDYPPGWPPPGNTSDIVDHVFGQPHPFVILSTSGASTHPAAAADADRTLLAVWEENYGSRPQLQFAYTFDGRIWQSAPTPNGGGLYAPRVGVALPGVFTIRARVTGHCYEVLQLVDFRGVIDHKVDSPVWTIPVIQPTCRVYLPVIAAEVWPPPKPKD